MLKKLDNNVNTHAYIQKHVLEDTDVPYLIWCQKGAGQKEATENRG